MARKTKIKTIIITPSQPRGGTQTKNKISIATESELNGDCETVTTYRRDNTTGAPLTMTAH